jgi:hypothetical protein
MQPDENPDNERLHKREKAALLALLLLLLRLKRGQISASVFVVSGQILLLQAYIAARAIGRGASATAADLKEARLDAAAQASYLTGLAADVLAGKYSAPGTAKALRARTTLYVLRMTGHANSAWAQRTIDESGSETEGLWDLGDDAPCGDCSNEADQGWRPLSDFTTFPGDGSTACLSRCKCSVVLRNGQRGFSNA